MEDLAVYGLRFLEDNYPDRLTERYGLTTVGDDISFRFLNILDHFVMCILKAAKSIMTKWQS